MATQYDPRDVVITWGEIDCIDPGDDTFVTVARAEDGIAPFVGPHGNVVIAINPNRSGTITWTASQNSPTNDRLSAQLELQETPGNGLVVKPLQVKHNNGTTICGGDAVLQKVADASFAKEHSPREWVWFVPDMNQFIGGSLR